MFDNKYYFWFKEKKHFIQFFISVHAIFWSIDSLSIYQTLLFGNNKVNIAVSAKYISFYLHD